ncbi:hypothetical protein ABB37_00605 [Leptomonas pyrrhocoris]|uniref:Uncharacterized protein n=1 Tax=Leptomonas pyrrhocoris TaxID=157538 RepID=A0A0M9GAQ7_LEPPY|nr:hypothetical protein ABB37_00605 [Leptomonas pyrrhocoris]XP_015664880.1 hypothetical protein ABB37_00605 [Leptomonas pyrrhocoris]KPA86440.1 hypothetical protein ABB37_00605 [Leptomonas pyrrhocoris]KPA86441.1 hypothetical protein ABB37_00605 [Leptomonas pyrrhocoris]|eukprot:XP_015664879.1 hypothetical protein ABB37_00605 [Leptomonas pyrrhocoris]
MVAWWPFSRAGNAATSSSGFPPMSGSSPSSADEGAVPFTRGIHDTTSYQNLSSGKERDYGESGVAQSEIDRVRDLHKVRRHNDARALVMDTESIECLVNRFENEFQAADAHIKRREASKPLLQRYDYENDRRYEQWRADQKAMRERLQIHFLDTLIDDAAACIIYYLRVCTTAGLCYGLGRTAYLYRTMDKTYAKLNGVSLTGIAFNEVITSVAKSAGVAIAGCFGVTVGDGLTGLGHFVIGGDVTRPERSWYNILGAGTTSGLFGGAAYVAMNYKDLTPWGMRAMLGAFTSVGMIGGLYLGYCVYRPFALQRTHALYDPYWRPWQTRNMRSNGPAHVRGKYL